jgi:glycosyltransferase involved in cell wall biosynthesis
MAAERSKRVLHVRSSGGVLGAERVVLELCRGAGAFGWHSALAVTHDAGEPVPELFRVAAAAGIDAHLLDCRHRFDLTAVARLRRLAERLRIDVVHCHGYRENLYAVLAGLARVRGVTTNHLWKRTTPALRLYARVDSWLVRRFSRVVAVSREVARELEGLGLTSPELIYIPNGVDVEAFAPPPQDLPTLAQCRRAIGAAPADVVVTAVSSLTAEKGHRYLIEAFAAVSPRHEGMRLLIVGDGPERARLEQQARLSGASSRIVFLGRREDVREILAITDVYTLPSLIEGLPIALLEAMAMARACVATDVGDVGRAIVDGDTGLLVTAGNATELAAALDRLVADPESRAKLGASARRAATSRFSAAEMVRSYCSVYDSLLSS